MKKNKIVVISVILMIFAFLFIMGLSIYNDTNLLIKEEKMLPLPEVTGGERGKLGIDKNINETNIDDYLNLKNAIYRDMRMLKDPGNYEAIGGDSYLSGYISGFEIIPLPYLIPVNNLPDEVGDTYTGRTLFSIDKNGEYVANYVESLEILENLFPKDKVIFLMCGGGGYAGMTKELLVSLGWNKDKIYNVGGYWFYNGKNSIQVKKTENGEITYDFDSVPYHDINFDELTLLNSKITLDSEYYNKVNDRVFDEELDLNIVREFNIDIPEEKEKANKFWEETINRKASIINDLLKNKKSFIVIVQNHEEACQPGEPDIFEIAINSKRYLNQKKIYSYVINLTIFRKTELFETVRYAPTVILINKGVIYKYIDLNKDSFKNDEELIEWLNNYIDIK